MKCKILFLDETGKAHYKHPSNYFIISGCIISENLQARIKNTTNKIIFKYWGNKRIILHTSQMFNKKGDFRKFKDEKFERNFWNDFSKYVLRKPYISFFIVSTNKQKAKKQGWRWHTIIEKSYRKILKSFAKSLQKTKSKGKIVAESSTDQDPYLVKTHSYLQRTGVDSKLPGNKYYKLITSLSLVKKLNYDIGAQIADIIATVGRIKNKDKKSLTYPEKKILEEFEKKQKNKNNFSQLKILL